MAGSSVRVRVRDDCVHATAVGPVAMQEGGGGHARVVGPLVGPHRLPPGNAGVEAYDERNCSTSCASMAMICDAIPRLVVARLARPTLHVLRQHGICDAIVGLVVAGKLLLARFLVAASPLAFARGSCFLTCIVATAGDSTQQIMKVRQRMLAEGPLQRWPWRGSPAFHLDSRLLPRSLVESSWPPESRRAAEG